MVSKSAGTSISPSSLKSVSDESPIAHPTHSQHEAEEYNTTNLLGAIKNFLSSGMRGLEMKGLK
jgi:hypothetical protein